MPPSRAPWWSSVADLARLARLRDDFAYFGSECLRIRNKSGDIEPFVFNDAQKVLHAALEKQRTEKGWVRAIILKGRQQGISTYTAARFYHKTAMRRGINTYILAHEQAASDNLFGIVDRYQRNSPLAPHVGVCNAKELVFDKLDSSYIVATAGTKAGGRSRAVSLFHGSEVAFWSNAPDHFAASVQGVPLMPGTEVILESTSAGAGGEFYERCNDAISGRGDYILVFLPWWLSSEYQRTPDPGFALSTDAEDGEMSEAEYAAAHGLSLAQMAWRRAKILELRSATLFQREYPATVAEAWTAPPGHEPFISPLSVARARKRKTPAAGPLILGVDPASNGGDRFSVAARRGMRVLWVRHRNKIDTLEGTAWIASLIDELAPARVNIDAGNIGAAIITNLKSKGPRYANLVRGVNFGGTSEAKLARPKVPGPKNRRAEMWQRSKDWLDSSEGAAIPDDDALQADATSPRLKPLLTNDFLLESKDDMRKRSVRSPDLWDSVVLTFASNEFFSQYTDAANTKQFGDIDAPRHNVVPQYGDTPRLAGQNSWMGAICAALISSPMLWHLAQMLA